jgi:hypothetical protein
VEVRVIPFSESVSFTVAFGTLAPDGSETVPDNAALELNVCAWRTGENRSPNAMMAIKTATTAKRNLVMLPPEIYSLSCSLFICPAAPFWGGAGGSASGWLIDWLILP